MKNAARIFTLTVHFAGCVVGESLPTSYSVGWAGDVGELLLSWLLWELLCSSGGSWSTKIKTISTEFVQKKLRNISLEKIFSIVYYKKKKKVKNSRIKKKYVESWIPLYFMQRYAVRNVRTKSFITFISHFNFYLIC